MSRGELNRRFPDTRRRHRAPSERDIEDVENEERVEYQINDDPVERRKLLQRADQVLEQIRQRQPSTIVFLDKSARPLAWLLAERSRHQGDELFPNIRFLDVGVASANSSGERRSELSSSNGLQGSQHEQGAWSRQHMYSTLFSGEWLELPDAKSNDADQSVLIVDDVVETGKSLEAAMRYVDSQIGDSTHVYGLPFSPIAGSKAARIPWLRTPGLSGVLDAPNGRDYATAISAERLEEMRSEAKRTKRTALFKFIHIAEEYLKTADQRLNEVLASIKEIDDPEYASFYARQVEKIHECFTYQRNPEVLSFLCSEIRSLHSSIKNEDDVPEEDLAGLKKYLNELKEVYTAAMQVVITGNDPNKYEDEDSLKKGNAQLRAEIRQLARSAENDHAIDNPEKRLYFYIQGIDSSTDAGFTSICLALLRLRRLQAEDMQRAQAFQEKRLPHGINQSIVDLKSALDQVADLAPWQKAEIVQAIDEIFDFE